MNTAPTSSKQGKSTQPEVFELDTHSYAVERLREVRRQKGIPVAELARRALMDEGKLGKVMRGERGLRYDEGLRVAYVLGLKVDEWLFPPEVLRSMNAACKGVDADVVPSAGRRGGARW